MELTSLNKDRKRRKVDADTLSYGRVPPQAKDLEEAVLGAIMLEARAFDQVGEILTSKCFYVEAHQVIFEAMKSVRAQNVIVEILSTVQELKKREELEAVGGPYYVTQLTNKVVSTANLDHHCRLIKEKFIAREIIRIGGEMISAGYEDSTDVFDLIDQTETSIFSLSSSFLKKDFEKIDSVGAKVLNRIDQLRYSDQLISGIPTGYSSLDRVTYGWQDTDLIIIAARPSVGKTAFALNLARNACNGYKNSRVGFFSLEMSNTQLVQRIMSMETEVDMSLISRGKMTDNDYNKLHRVGMKRFETMPLWIDDSAALNIFEFRAKARRMVNKHGVNLIIIDYLQLMNGSKEKNGNREQEISSISRNLKALAKELNIPIIALSQLSRDIEKRSGKEPQLSDLRESGAIEQDADMVCFIYREEAMNGELVPTKFRIAKHRNGSLETIDFNAKLNIQKFEEWQGEVGLPSNYKPVDEWSTPVKHSPKFQNNENEL